MNEDVTDGMDIPFKVDFTDDGSLDVEFAEKFLEKSVEEQREMVERYYGQKMSEPIDSGNVGADAARNETVILFVEVILARLKRGERIKPDSKISISIKDLMTPDV